MVRSAFMAYPQHLKDRFIEMRVAGLSFDKIAAAIEVSKPTLLKWGIEFSTQTADLASVKYQAFLEQHRLTAREQMQESVELLKKVMMAIKAKDLEKENLRTLLEMKRDLEDGVNKLSAHYKEAAGANKVPETPTGIFEGWTSDEMMELLDICQEPGGLAKHLAE